MGAIHDGLPIHFTLSVAAAKGVETLVETGTYLGGTTEWASHFFKKVISIESDRDLFRSAKSQFESYPNLELYEGNSPEVLQEIVPALRGPCLFFLDAHWSAGVTDKTHGECPVLDEIEQLNQRDPQETFVFIDDARLFIDPLPEPLSPAEWPSLKDVLKALDWQSRHHEVALIDDLLVSLPAECFKTIKENAYAQYLKYTQKTQSLTHG